MRVGLAPVLVHAGLALATACDRAPAGAVAPPAPVTAPPPARAAASAATVAPPPLPADGGSPAFDADRAWAHLRNQVALGPRPAGSPAAAAARQYIADALAQAGLTVTEQAFEPDTPIGRIPMANVIATLPGRRDARIAIASHYDTKRFREFPFVGASDGASSTAVLIELGRVLARDAREYTIELIFFDGEEAVLPEWSGSDNTYGSRYYVDAARDAGTLDSLEALVLLDLVGDRDLAFRREANSTPWLTDLIWAAADRLGYGAVFLDAQTPIEDDHLPFLRAGVPATDIIDLDYPAWHTAADDLPRVSARSLDITGQVVLAALPDIEAYLSGQSAR
jgi:Zn-dependent M28 family amino/carboxypeptidase